jgi:hypothetical protein
MAAPEAAGHLHGVTNPQAGVLVENSKLATRERAAKRLPGDRIVDVQRAGVAEH